MKFKHDDIAIVGEVSTLTLGPGVYEAEGDGTFDYGCPYKGIRPC